VFTAGDLARAEDASCAAGVRPRRGRCGAWSKDPYSPYGLVGLKETEGLYAGGKAERLTLGAGGGVRKIERAHAPFTDYGCEGNDQQHS
jgi:hypothetical protein